MGTVGHATTLIAATFSGFQCGLLVRSLLQSCGTDAAIDQKPTTRASLPDSEWKTRALEAFNLFAQTKNSSGETQESVLLQFLLQVGATRFA